MEEKSVNKLWEWMDGRERSEWVLKGLFLQRVKKRKEDVRDQGEVLFRPTFLRT